jgi:3-phenylpropionate/trans-cinnamate dioxygenase ferredoxin subunit
VSENSVIEKFPALAGRSWHRACNVAAIPEDEGHVLSTVPKTSVFAVDAEYFCIDDTCTHETYSLAEGWLEGCVVECTLHMAKFDLRTGAVVSPPAQVPVAVHPVVRVGDELYVALPEQYLVKSD